MGLSRRSQAFQRRWKSPLVAKVLLAVRWPVSGRKRPTKQSEVLTSDHVWALEKLVVETAPSIESLIGGQDLFICLLFMCSLG